MAGLRSFLLFLALMLGASLADAAEVIYPPGSRLGLVPPSGMVTSSNFFGFEDPNTHAAIILASLPIEAYAELEKTAGAEALKRQGITLEKREPMPLSTGKAFLVIGRQEIEKTKVRKWILVGESLNLTALVTVQIPDTVKDLYSDSAIRASLASLAIRDSIPVDEQLSLLPFKAAELAGFRVGGVMPGRALMLGDPATDAAAPPTPHIFVAVAPGGPAQTSEREAFARDVFGTVANIRDVRVVSSEPLRIGGQPGHQIMAQARDPSGAATLTVVQWLRFGGGAYLQLVGIARVEAWHEAYPRFRAVRDGIEPR